MSEFEKLQSCLEYSFKNIDYLRLALAHRSSGKRNNERLEFLGDSILGFLIADSLYHSFPNAREGVLSRHRAHLVQKPTLAELAREINLGECLLLGQGERKSGGKNRDSILADAMEAVLCAVYLDGGIEQCRSSIRKLYRSRLDSLEPDNDFQKDPKTRLQEYLQANKKELPVYKVIEITGQDHDQIFKVSCQLKKPNLEFEGEGGNRRDAEQQAAEKALFNLDN